MIDAWSEICSQITLTIGHEFVCGEAHPVRGGCINTAHVVSNGAQRFFIKTNRAEYAGMFAAEAEGLLELAKTNVVRVPAPICWGAASGSAYLVLEYVEFSEPVDQAAVAFGTQLAQLHRVTERSFGWYRDNTIGSTRQCNTREDSWAKFWREHR
ncbi:MAG: fructosamine kinase family protein, partial [Gammaproteobacteria bacterium]|nr:fructosamine kinase family protein [Gammaproteobacteria bacterium]